MPAVIVSNRRFCVVPDSAKFWFLGGPEADAPWHSYYQSGWSKYDAQLFVNAAGAWHLASATSGARVNDEPATPEGVRVQSGDVIRADSAADIMLFCFQEGRDADSLASLFERAGLSRETRPSG